MLMPGEDLAPRLLQRAAGGSRGTPCPTNRGSAESQGQPRENGTEDFRSVSSPSPARPIFPSVCSLTLSLSLSLSLSLLLSLSLSYSLSLSLLPSYPLTLLLSFSLSLLLSFSLSPLLSFPFCSLPLCRMRMIQNLHNHHTIHTDNS